MRKKTLRIVSLVLVAAALLTNMVFAAESRESKYITSYMAMVVDAGNGMVKVNFNVTGTRTLPTLGAMKIDIYSFSEGKIFTFDYTDPEYEDIMMGTNTFLYGNSVYYQGKVGEKYAALVKFYAADDKGSDTATYSTAFVEMK